MCGIAGYWGEGQADPNIALTMASQISTRGPDDFGVWCARDIGLALSHRRLSVLDLTDAGHQPMVSDCGRYTLVFNGELYNHGQIRSELERSFPNVLWRGHSDTETLLRALVYWGVEPTLEKLNGMFAFGFWDDFEKTLVIARDRMGEKPVYFGRSGGVFLFASELKALCAHPQWSGEVDRDSVALYLRRSCVPAPHCIYKGIFKLLPAHYVQVKDGGRSISDPKCYWNLRRVAEKGVDEASRECRSDSEIRTELEALLYDSVDIRCESDVPLGSFLSGGYDSTTITALMQSRSSSPIRTFSIGFEQVEFNEAPFAKEVAKHLGTEHTELYVSEGEGLEVVQKLGRIYDEPFADSSQIPTVLLCQLAKEHVTVALSGDGGDELFAGYNRHVSGPGIWDLAHKLPKPIRNICARSLSSLSRLDLDSLVRSLPRGFRPSGVQNKVYRVSEALLAENGRAFYESLASHWQAAASIALGANAQEVSFRENILTPEFASLRDTMLYLDQTCYLPNDILTKVDRASMAVSLECRVPFLDHRLVEFSWGIPQSRKVKDGQGKWLVRQVLHKYVPESMMNRPKQGFGIPLADWLRGPLREWGAALLEEQRVVSEGFFDPAAIRYKWEAHQQGRDGFQYELWDVLMFQTWLDANPKAH